MKFIKLNLFVIVLAIVSAAVWMFGFASIHLAIFKLLGRPEEFAQFQWAGVLIQSFVMGAIPGIVVVFMEDRPFKEVTIVFLSGIIAFIVLASIASGGLGMLLQLLLSAATWLFLGGAVFGGFSMDRVKNPV